MLIQVVVLSRNVLMHPVVILLPAVALIFGPRLWVNHVLKQYGREDPRFRLSASETARELLDQRGLQSVRVEVTDRGDHYDPQDLAVRLARDKHDRKTLTAVTTAAHEVAHALQHASAYGPFVWRTRLAKLAQITGEIGSGLLLAVPAAALITRNPVPPTIIGIAALSMLGTGVVAQVAALPSELDASFNRALPMLRSGYIDADQNRDAHRILLACSLTYVASSLVAVLNIWPWLGSSGYLRRPVAASIAAAGLDDLYPRSWGNARDLHRRARTTGAGLGSFVCPTSRDRGRPDRTTAALGRPHQTSQGVRGETGGGGLRESSDLGNPVAQRPRLGSHRLRLDSDKAAGRGGRQGQDWEYPRPGERLLRPILKPLIRGWFKLASVTG